MGIPPEHVFAQRARDAGFQYKGGARVQRQGKGVGVQAPSMDPFRDHARCYSVPVRDHAVYCSVSIREHAVSWSEPVTDHFRMIIL